MMSNDLTVAKIFNDYMVLQRDMNIKVWGTGKEGAWVTLTIGEQIHHTTVYDNRWQITLAPLSLGGSLTMTITSNTEQIIISDLLVGDVYLASGQSNMAMPLRVTKDGLAEIESANFPSIRICDMVVRPYASSTAYLGGDDEVGWEIKSTDLNWVPCETRFLKNFSALGYHFAKYIHNAIQVPIGIVNCSFGGRPICAWIEESYFFKDAQLLDYYYDFKTQLDTINSLSYTAEFAEYLVNIQRFIHGQTEVWPMEPIGPFNTSFPSTLFHSMLESILPFAFKAVLWYQGESDELIPALYTKLFTALIHNWRDRFENPNLPFFFVQLPCYDTKESSPDPYLWGHLRMAQEAVARTVPHTYRCVTLDVGELEDIHPKNKRIVAYRLSLLVRKYLYDEPILADSPTIASVTLNNNSLSLSISFNPTTTKLHSKGTNILGFSVIDSNNKVHSLPGMLNENKVYLDISTISGPYAIHYCYESACHCNLYNEAELPICAVGNFPITTHP